MREAGRIIQMAVPEDIAEDALASLFLIPVSVKIASPQDRHAPIFSGEHQAVAKAVTTRREEFAAGRAAARAALVDFGFAQCEIPPGPGRRPIWPSGAIGSITHVDELCVAVVAPGHAAVGLGIDAVVRKPLPEGVGNIVCTQVDHSEIARLRGDLRGIGDSLVFCAKEAFYKAHYPVALTFLEFSDVSIRFDTILPSAGTFMVVFENKNLPLSAMEAQFIGRFRVFADFVVAGMTFTAF
jgi:4'-phosphopantetheinyl transferase EntD